MYTLVDAYNYNDTYDNANDDEIEMLMVLMVIIMELLSGWW